jgi:Acetyltransferase (GNAT) domain
MSDRPADTAGSAERDGVRRPAASRRQVRVLRSIPELGSVREGWLRLQGDQIYTDPDFYEVSQLDPAVVRPHVVVLERAGVAEAMLVARIEQLRLPSRLGYRSLYAPEVRSITVVYGGVLGDPDEDAFRVMLASFRASLAEGEADIAIFRYLPVDSAYYRIASTEVPFLGRQHFGESELRWEIELPGSLDDLLGLCSTKSRRNLVSYARKLERTYEGRLAVRKYTRLQEIDDFFRDIEIVAPKTYQDALGVALRDTPVHRARTELALRRGWFRGYVLTVDGRPCSFQYGELYRGRFRLGRPGYDPALAQLRIGTYLLMKVLDDLCQDAEARVVDRGTGEGPHKERFATDSWPEGNVIVYAPTFRGARINLTRTVLERLIGATKRVAGRGELARSLKKRFRRQAVSSSSSASG